jgi:hypothetical protein
MVTKDYQSNVQISRAQSNEQKNDVEMLMAGS